MSLSSAERRLNKKHFFLLMFRYFKQVLPLKYFTHFKLLAFAMNLAESSVLEHDTIKTIKFLLDEFDRLFSLFYSVSTSSHVHTVTYSSH